jgi:small-conductance mechanosensitive channel
VLITAALSLVGVDTWLGVIVGAAIVGLAVGWLTRRAEQL